MKVELIVESGPDAGRRTTLVRETPCTVGTAESCGLRLRDPAVQPEHFVVKAMKDEGFGAKALAGATRVNGAEIQATRLRDGDVLEAGRTRLRFQVAAPAGATAAGDAPKTLGEFRLLDVLGRGGMGIVYRAEQTRLHREVALKVLSKELTKDPVFVARFMAEARAAARLSHPNVVQIFDANHDGDTYFYSMEVMHNGSLEQRLKKEGKLPPADAVKAILDAAKGLAYAESMRMVHRDIKPDNLMIDRHGTVKIVDLGLAGGDDDEHGKVLGTPHFMSPEQIQGKPLDHRSDLYSLGCTFFRLVTGRTPFQGATSKDIVRAQLTEEAPLAHKIEPSVPTEVSAVITRLLAKDPAQRYGTAGEVIAELQHILHPPVRRGIWIAAAGLAVVVAGGALWWALTRTPETHVIVREKDNPEAARIAEEKRQLEADNARLKVEAQGLEGIPKAEALEAMARAHPETKAAARALADAKALREQVAAAERARQARALAVQAAVAKIEQAAGSAREAGDWRAALAALDPLAVDAAVRDDAAVQAAIATQKEALRAAAASRLAAGRGAVEQAFAQRDPAAVRAALATLQNALDPATGIPTVLRAENEPTAPFVKEVPRRLDQLEKALASEGETRAWLEYEAGATGARGVLALVTEGDLAGAAARAEALAQSVQGKGPAQKAAALAGSTAAAARAWQRYQAAIGKGEVVAPTGEGDATGTVTAFVLAGPQAGVTLQTGPKNRPKTITLPLTQVTDLRLAALLPPLQADPAPNERAALLGLLSLAAHLRGAHEWLAAVRGDDEVSGTGAQAYPLPGLLLGELERSLRDATEPWAEGLRAELAACERLVTALRAFSDRRNVSAAAHLDRLLKDHARALVVLGL
ncbi:MAG: protein kinase [Planctomycetes bacterium]|nr:protein kinase [Planctomycetota bacterium]